jgi:hypothetical protein
MIRRTNDYLVRALNNFANLFAASSPVHPTHSVPSEVKASINRYYHQRSRKRSSAPIKRRSSALMK